MEKMEKMENLRGFPLAGLEKSKFPHGILAISGPGSPGSEGTGAETGKLEQEGREGGNRGMLGGNGGASAAGSGGRKMSSEVWDSEGIPGCVPGEIWDGMGRRENAGIVNELCSQGKIP